MVGEGVLYQCLNSEHVESVLVIGRRTCGYQHDKLKELLVKDLADLSEVESQLSGYNACYFCAGISSVGISKEKYKVITYDLTLAFAKTLLKLNNNMTWCYVSGAGTDETEKRKGWASVKGKVENDTIALGFKDAYAFRPGYIQPIKGLKNTYTFYRIFGPMYPILKALFGKYVVTLAETADAMIAVTLNPSETKFLECNDLRKIAAGLS